MTIQTARDEVVRAAMAHWREPANSPKTQGLASDLDTACLALFEADHTQAIEAAVAAERERILAGLPKGDALKAVEVTAVVRGQVA